MLIVGWVGILSSLLAIDEDQANVTDLHLCCLISENWVSGKIQTFSAMKPVSRQMQPGQWKHCKFCFCAAVKSLQPVCSLERAWNSSGPTRPSYFKLQAKLFKLLHNQNLYIPGADIQACGLRGWWRYTCDKNLGRKFSHCPSAQCPAQ